MFNCHSLIWRFRRISLLYDRVRRLGSNTALVLPVAGHTDIALLSPVTAPRVLHDPEVLREISHTLMRILLIVLRTPGFYDILWYLNVLDSEVDV